MYIWSGLKECNISSVFWLFANPLVFMWNSLNRLTIALETLEMRTRRKFQIIANYFHWFLCECQLHLVFPLYPIYNFVYYERLNDAFNENTKQKIKGNNFWRVEVKYKKYSLFPIVSSFQKKKRRKCFVFQLS